MEDAVEQLRLVLADRALFRADVDHHPQLGFGDGLRLAAAREEVRDHRQRRRSAGASAARAISTGIATAYAIRSGERAASTFGVYSPNSVEISGIAIRLKKKPQLPNSVDGDHRAGRRDQEDEHVLEDDDDAEERLLLRLQPLQRLRRSVPLLGAAPAPGCGSRPRPRSRRRSRRIADQPSDEEGDGDRHRDG